MINGIFELERFSAELLIFEILDVHINYIKIQKHSQLSQISEFFLLVGQLLFKVIVEFFISYKIISQIVANLEDFVLWIKREILKEEVHNFNYESVDGVFRELFENYEAFFHEFREIFGKNNLLKNMSIFLLQFWIVLYQAFNRCHHGV